MRSICLLVFLLIACSENKKETSLNTYKSIVNIDSLISIIKKDTLYKVKKVLYSNDSSIQIVVADPKPAETASYFYKQYSISTCDNIDGVKVYKKSISEKNFLYGSTKSATRDIDFFRANHINKWDGSCPEIEEAIKKGMSDPNSFEHVKTTVDAGRKKGVLEVTMQFRGSTLLGDKISNSVTATINNEGNILSIK